MTYINHFYIRKTLTQMKIIGISGKLGSGKDSLAKLISNELSHTNITWFAYKLKQITQVITSCEFEDLFTQEGKNKFCPMFDRTLGQILQEMGTDVIRDNFDVDTWVKSTILYCENTKHFYWYEKLVNKLKPNTFKGREYTWLVPDLRFPNEADAIKNVGGVLIRIEGDPKGVRLNSNRNLNHASETALDDYTKWDYVINNDSTFDNLKKEAQKVATQINFNN